MTADTEEPASRTALGTNRRVLGSSLADDEGDVRQGLYVVDDGRLAVETLDRRKGRLQTRLAAQTLKGVQQRCLLPADVGPRTAVDDQLAAPIAAEDLLAGKPSRVDLGHRLLQQLTLGSVLAPDIDEGVRYLQRKRRDEHPLNELMGELLHQVAVLETARL